MKWYKWGGPFTILRWMKCLKTRTLRFAGPQLHGKWNERPTEMYLSEILSYVVLHQSLKETSVMRNIASTLTGKEKNESEELEKCGCGAEHRNPRFGSRQVTRSTSTIPIDSILVEGVRVTSTKSRVLPTVTQHISQGNPDCTLQVQYL